jgi:bacillithiol biosynthesis deacetylase BshB1
MKLDLLAIAAHPDDVELSCAGTLMMEKRQGKKVGIVDLTRGELGTRGNETTRQQEAAEAFNIMGLDVRENLGLPDGFFQNLPEHQLAVVAALRKYQPAVVLTNAPADRHPDHGRAAALVRDSAFLSGLRKVQTTYLGEEQPAWRPSYVFHFVQDRFLQPSFVYDITEAMEQKIAAIRAFKTQFNAPIDDDEPQTYISSPGFLESVIERSKMFGKMIGVPFAEGFISEKMLGIAKLDTVIQHVT